MFIKKNVSEVSNRAHGYLRDKLIRELNKNVVVIKKSEVQEEKLRKEMLDKIKKGELKAIPA